VSAWKDFPIFKGSTYYEVVVENGDTRMFPAGVRIELRLMRGNEGDDLDLNPRLYRRLSAADQSR
jgi:hypothetical protein